MGEGVQDPTNSLAWEDAAIRTLRSHHIATAFLTVTLVATGAEPAESRPDWLTGGAFQERLMQPATVFWTGSPLREHLFGFARAQRVAIVLDRRVDPEQKLTLAMRDEPVLGVVQAVAKSRNLQAVVFRNVVYLALPEEAARIRTVAELRRQEIEEVGRDTALKFARQASMGWEDLATPRDLLSELAEENELEIVNLDQVPHDLWPAGELPSMTLAERLTLILHQFGLTFRLAADGRRVAVVPVPRDIAVVRDYPGGGKPEALVEKWHDACPGSEFRIVGNRIFVRGLVEDHETIQGMRTSGGRQATRPRPTEKNGRPLEQVFTAEVPGRPLGAVLKHFATQLGLELKVDAGSLQDAGVSLEQPISFQVENVTFDELFRAVLDPVGCTYERQGNVMKIRAKQQEPVPE